MSTPYVVPVSSALPHPVGGLVRGLMTYGDRMPTPEAPPAPPDGGDRKTSEGASGPVVTADSVEFRVSDRDHEFDGVRLEVDWGLGNTDPEFSWSSGRWSLL